MLDEDHYDLEKIKDRILEFLAVRKLKNDSKGPILCFVGPPGVGKTSLGRSIARAMGRKFIRISLGGMRDEAEIRGHRRTYIGALPGRIIQGLRTAGSNNPVFMLDEIDKLGADFRGDPASALLEVLDPEQNNTFQDHYLDVPFDLSKVMFITTANLLDPIPPPLRDRMEVIELAGYTDEEKLQIARRHLIPKQLAENGLSAEQLTLHRRGPALPDPSLHARSRAAEPRARDRQHLPQGRARASPRARPSASIATPEKIRELLGPERYFSEVAERTDEPGVAVGLAWTPMGGDIIFIEATKMAGKKGIMLTGNLGDVMKESAQAALSYIRSRAPRLGIAARLLREHGHPHPRSRRRGAEGRAVGGRDHRHGAGLAAHRPPGAARRGDDRRDHAARQGAAGRRHQGEGARRAPRRHPDRHPAQAQRKGSRGRAGGDPHGDALRLRRHRRPGARARAGAGDYGGRAAPCGGRGTVLGRNFGSVLSLAAARRLALSFPEVTEQDHHGMPSFRVQGKIFATVPDQRHLHVMLDSFMTHAAVGTDPVACEELWWGKQLSGVRIKLAHVARSLLADLLEEAWLRRAPKRLRDAYERQPPRARRT